MRSALRLKERPVVDLGTFSGPVLQGCGALDSVVGSDYISSLVDKVGFNEGLKTQKALRPVVFQLSRPCHNCNFDW